MAMLLKFGMEMHTLGDFLKMFMVVRRPTESSNANAFCKMWVQMMLGGVSFVRLFLRSDSKSTMLLVQR